MPLCATCTGIRHNNNILVIPTVHRRLGHCLDCKDINYRFIACVVVFCLLINSLLRRMTAPRVCSIARQVPVVFLSRMERMKLYPHEFPLHVSFRY